MISFAEGSEGGRDIELSSSQLKKLVDAVMKGDPFAEGSRHGGLHPDYIKEIVNHLMFVEENHSIYIIVDKEADGFHLSVTIDRKEK